jgi:hypothetical protein
MLKKLISALLSGVLFGLAMLVVPQPTNAVAGETFYISADPTPAASVGAGTSCTDADVEYDPATGLESALAAIYEDPDFDSGDEIVLCDVDATDGEVDYVMLADVSFDDGNFDDDNDPLTPDAATLDLSDGVAPGSITIRGDADDADSIVIDANDGVGLDDGGYSPFDFTDADVTIENLTILNAWDDSSGGAIHVIEADSTEGVSLTLHSVIIEYAYVLGGDGAGVHVAGDVVITDSVFEDNGTGGAPAGNGAAVYATGDVTITDSDFVGNTAGQYGGAVYVDGGSQVSVSNTVFDGNEAQGEGGAIWVNDLILSVQGSLFTNNSTDGLGGAIYTYDSSWSVTDSTFGSADDDHDDPDLENYADEGGDIYSATGIIEDAVTATITNSKFYDSRSTGLNVDGDGDGASLYLECTAASIANSLFHSTEADVDGVIKIDDDGGCEDYRVSISRTTFTDNYANSDGVIFVDAGSESDGISGLLSLSVTNSLFSGNVADQDEGVFDVEGPVDVSIINSRFERNSTGDNGAIIEMDGGDDDSDTTNGSLTFSRNHVRFNNGGTDSENGDGMIQLDDVHSWQIDYNTFQGNSADRGAVLAFEVDADDLRDLVQLNGFRRNTIIGNSASVGGSYLFIQYNDNASNVNRASIKRIETQVKKNRNVIKGGTRPQILQLLDFLVEPG